MQIQEVSNISYCGREASDISHTAAKQPLSDNTKRTAAIFIGTGALAAAAITIAILKSRAFRLAEHIDFRPAKTIEEAIEFGKKQLGIKGYAIDDLETTNWVHEGLVNLNNMTKGKAKMPYGIGNVDMGDIGFALMTTDKKRFILNVNKSAIKDIDNYIERGVKYVKSHGITLPYQLNENLKRFKLDCNLIQKIKLSEDLEMLVNPYTAGTEGNSFRKIYHEMGHLEHALKCGKDFALMGKESECIKNFGKVTDISSEFLNTPAMQQIAGEVSDYAKQSPLEFVAEAYSYIAAGRKFDDEIMALYNKYKGPSLFSR